MRRISTPPPQFAAQLTLLRLSHDAILVRDAHSGQICFWNGAAEELYGWTRDEALGQPAHALLQTELPESLRVIEAGLEGDDVWQGELERTCRDGSRVRVASRWGVIHDGSGQPAAYVEMDIRVHADAAGNAEAALRASEQRVRRLIDSNIIGISLGDLEGRILDANDAMLDIVGYSREDLKAGQLRWDRITPPEYWAAEERAIAEAQRVGAASPWEKEYIRKDGQRVPVLVGFALLDPRSCTTVAFILDLSEQKRAELERERLLAENRRQQALLEAVFAASPAGLAVVAGAPPTIRFVNPAYLTLAPHPESDVLGRRLDEVWPGAEVDGLMALVRQALGSGAPAGLERYTRQSADGDTRTFSLEVVGLTWESEPAALIALWETTALEEARAAAETAVRARDEFISVASHELKTPISALLMLAQLTRRRVERGRLLEPAQVSEFAEHLHWQADRLSRLGSQLLDTSRIKAGQLALQPEPTDLAGLVRAVARAISQDRTIEIHAPVSLMANVDPVRLEQVVRNLLDNAIKYSPARQQIEVDLSQTTPSTARLAVRDHGIGVPLEHRSHIFERFYRAHADGQTSGMGLGLHISRQIVEQHGGQIEAEFPPDGGTCFVVTLPTVPSVSCAAD